MPVYPRSLQTGFHNETEEDFQQTLSLMKRGGVDSAFMFKYSERPGTRVEASPRQRAGGSQDRTSQTVMIALADELSEESNRRDVGKENGIACGGTPQTQCRRACRSHITEQGRVFSKGDTIPDNL